MYALTSHTSTQIIFGLLLLFLVSACAPVGISSSTESGMDGTQLIYAQQSDGDGSPVTVAVTPKVISPDPAIEWVFEIVLNTHSVPLDYDLTQNVTLIDDSGTSYVPLRYDGMPPGGHHRSGTLVFAPINPFPDSITVEVRDIGNKPVRTFIWNTVSE